MNVSVIICTWNRAHLLDQTLERMRELVVPAGLLWEVVIVNNNCTDHTPEVIAKHSGHLPLRSLDQPIPGKVHAANLAIEEVRGDILLWTDDDVLVLADWLGQLWAGIERHPDAAGFGGMIEPWFPVEPDPVLMEAFPPLKMGFCGLDLGSIEREMASDEYAYGANMAFRSDKVRGIRFDRSLGRFGGFMGGHEDKDYQDRVRADGGRLVWLPGLKVRHYVDPARMTVQHMANYYYGVGVSDIRRNGTLAGASLFGAPRYLYRIAANRYTRFLTARIRGDRRIALEQLRGYHYQLGLIDGCREASRRKISGGKA